VVWQSRPTEGQRSYASAILYQGDGFRLLLASTTTELIALVPETGEIVWVHKHWQADRDANGDSGHIFTNTPTIQGRDVFLTRGYNYPCIMLTISSDGKSVQEKWSNGILDNHHHGVSCVDGYIYGSNWLSNAQGNWVCLDWNTGEMKWEQPWNNKGPIIQADGMLYIMDEKSGNFGLLAPDPGGFNLVSTFRIEKGTGPYWSHPSIYDGRLYVRHGEVLMVYRIK
jgi:outer membrane protein assembly factor BamB